MGGRIVQVFASNDHDDRDEDVGAFAGMLSWHSKLAVEACDPQTVTMLMVVIVNDQLAEIWRAIAVVMSASKSRHLDAANACHLGS